MVSEEATLTVSSVAVTLPALPDATLVQSFTTSLGAGVVYRGSVSAALDQIAEALVTAGFTAVDSADPATADAPADTAATTTTDAAAAPATAATTTDTAAAATGTTATTPATGTAATGTTDTAAAGTANTAAATDTSATSASGTGMGLDSLPAGVVRTFERGGEQFELRAYERGGFTIVLISRLGRAGTTPAS